MFTQHVFRLSLLLLVVSAALPHAASAQYFGRNKVQYESFDWRVLKTEHFDLHYYPEEERAVRDAARMAERWYGRLSSVFQRQFTERKTIVFYADQSDFQQTTVIREMLGQGTGGVTEGIKTRVILPMTGNLEDTDHVLGHELVHVFQYDILREQRTRERGGTFVGTSAGRNLPLWFVEGLAEYLSLGRESPQTAMWLRDALARDKLPTVDQLARDPRLFPYRWGHALWAYVGGRWDDPTVGRLFARGTDLGLEAAVLEVLGLKVKDLSDQWRDSIRQAYTPVLERRQPPAALGARRFPGEDKTIDEYIAPSLSPDGSQVVFFATRSLFSFDLYLADARTGRIEGRLVSESSDRHFDALRFLDSAGAWSPDSRKLAFVVFAQGDNDLAVLDIASRKIERRYKLDGVGELWNPAWSPDGRSIVLSGSAGGISDLYLVDVASGSVRKLTDDVYADLQPTWSPDGRSIAFVSDRGAGAEIETLTRRPMGIWQIDPAGGQVRELVPGTGSVARGNRFNPQFGQGGRDLFFLSDEAGATDLYRASLDTGERFRVTRATTGVTGITRLSPALTVAPRSGDVMVSVFTDTRYEIHAFTPEQARGEAVVAETAAGEPPPAGLLPPAQARTASVVSSYLADATPLPALANPEISPYRSRYQLDFVSPGVGVGVSSLGYSFGGDLTAFFSDTLGQKEIGFSLQGVTGSGSTLDEIGAQGYYLNQKRRWQWGVGGGHVPYISAIAFVGTGIVDVDGQPTQATIIQEQRQTVTEDQVQLLNRYPLSATRRFEADFGVTRLSFDNELREVIVVGDQVIDNNRRDLRSPPAIQVYQGSFAFVGDTSNFGFTAPVSGQRYRVEVSPTFGDLRFNALTLDYRRYFFRRPVTLALRGLHVGRYGTDAESDQLAPLYVGSPTLVRGYEVGDIGLSECTPVPDQPGACPEFDRLVGSRVGVANLELRLPLLGVRGYGLIPASFLPTDLAFFVDAGTAWSKGTSPVLRFERQSAERVPVVSAGVSTRILLGGFAVLEFYYAKPFQRPGEGWVTGFTIAPGW
jgi:hypothetical protein